MSTEMKQMAITLVDEAVNSGSRIVPACELLGLSSRTYRRWRSRPKTSSINVRVRRS